MSFLLEPDNYPSVHPLFEEMTYHLAVEIVLAGILPGRIYVDDPGCPGTAILIPSNQHRIYVSGEPEPGMAPRRWARVTLLFASSLGENTTRILVKKRS